MWTLHGFSRVYGPTEILCHKVLTFNYTLSWHHFWWADTKRITSSIAKKRKCQQTWKNVYKTSLSTAPTSFNTRQFFPYLLSHPAMTYTGFKCKASAQSMTSEKKQKMSATTSKPIKSAKTASKKPSQWWQSPTIEVIDDEDKDTTTHGGPPKRSDCILEASDGSYDNDKDDKEEEFEEPEESAEKELGKCEDFVGRAWSDTNNRPPDKEVDRCCCMNCTRPEESDGWLNHCGIQTRRKKKGDIPVLSTHQNQSPVCLPFPTSTSVLW